MELTLRIQKDGDRYDVALIDPTKTGIEALLYTMPFKFDDFPLIQSVVTGLSSFFDEKIDGVDTFKG
jgi:hypothetical protein